MCAQVLAQDGGNAKALFRRGRAHAALGRSEEALRDLQAAAQAAPEDKGIQREIAAAKGAMRKEREAQVQRKGICPSCMPHRMRSSVFFPSFLVLIKGCARNHAC